MGAFNKTAPHPLQSWEWGEFRKETGNEVIRLGIYEKSKLKDVAQVIFSKIPYTNLKIGTLIRGSKPTEKILVALKDLAKRENAIFIKLEPFVATSILDKYAKEPKEFPANYKKILVNDAQSIKRLLSKVGGTPGKTLFTPTSFWIDLTKSEDELLKSFKSKTRYNVRYAKRKGVVVEEDNSDKAFEKYLKLMRETVERQGFYAHSEKYHRLMWKHLHKNLVSKSQQPIARLLVAKYKKEILTAWIVFVWKKFLFYPYGASTDKYKNLQANSLMMWEAMRTGKKLNLETFDLWGREPGEGFTRFKEGFNPHTVEFLGTWDLITSPLYHPYKPAEYIRWEMLKLLSSFRKPSF